MRRAAAFFAAAMMILLLSLVVTRGQFIMATGILAILAALAFAAWPVEGMSVVGFVACLPIVALQVIVGLPTALAMLLACGVVVFTPPALGIAGFMTMHRNAGEIGTIIFLVLFITLWLAMRKLHRTAIIRTAKTTWDLWIRINDPIDQRRRQLLEYFEAVGRWMTS